MSGSPDPPFSPSAVLANRSHRPWPLPARPWCLTMRWSELCFAHWAVDPASLRDAVPEALELDSWEGRAWLGIVPFRMSHVRFRGLPELPGHAAFPELNVRTYVRFEDRPGVWFFSLDATDPWAVRVARATFHLPYYRANIRLEATGDEVVVRHARTHRGAPPAALAMRYAPSGPPRRAEPGTLEHFLTERYRLYAARGRSLWAGDIQHPPWLLAPAQAAVEANSMTLFGPELELAPTPDHLLFAEQLDVLAWWPRRLSG